MSDQLTDREALRRFRLRAARSPEIFLHEEAAAGIHEKLISVNRTFTSPAIISAFSQPWKAILPDAKIIADEETLALSPASHDLVISGLVMHWNNDPTGHLIQARRALKPDGLFLGVCFGGQTLHQLRAVFAKAELQVRQGISPRVAPMAEIRDLGSLLQRAGLTLPVCDVDTLTVRYRDLGHMMRDLRAMGESNALAARDRRFAPRALFEVASQIYSDVYGDRGKIPATFDLITLTGWSAGPNQPQPLRPGSATTRLAEALGTPELPLRDSDKD